ncbi:MAG: hypothetical protein M3R47_03000 [Chloroflexota bacterium]|nr:hypothetical protein [Chloroflexota bacterium]
MAAYEYKFGQTEAGMALLPSLGIRGAPESGYRPFAATITLGDATLKGQGYPVITWHWAFLTVAERAVFVTPLAGALSGTAFIRTRKPDNTWANYQCIQNLPTGEENLSVGKIIGFDIEFTHCILIP